jgi:8-oxo-dGTP pyrophosphatase MutT (NUDIX family)
MARKNGRWLVKNTRTVYQNEFFTLAVDDVVNPQQEDDEYATIRYKDSVAVLVLDENDQLILTKQFRYALGKDNIEVAAGTVENESPLEAARREIKEELGIIAEDWRELGTFDANPSMTNDRKSLFLARQLTFTEPDREPTEDIETYRISFADALEKVRTGGITHDLTCLLILKAAEIIKRD